MESKNRHFSPIDLADTGQWRLVLLVSESGMSAYLRHNELIGEPPLTLFSKNWEPDTASLLKKIEDCVYDNPRLLDDYATEVVVETPKAIFVPASVIEEGAEEDELFNNVYSAESEDIITDSIDDVCCIYSLAPGLPAFLRRTLPGAKIRHHLSVLVERLRNQTSEMPRIYADIREKEADILIFKGKSLLSASTHCWMAPADIAYRILLAMQSYGLKSENVEVRISGLAEEKSELAGILRKILSYVVFTPEPSGVAEEGMTLSVALASENTRTSKPNI